MAGRIRPHLTYANVMVTILTFVVLGGTAWALARNSVGSRQLKPNAVKEIDIANDAVTGPKVRDGSLEDDDFAAGTLLTGPQGPPGERGQPGEPGQPGAPGQDATNNFAYISDTAAAGTAGVGYGSGVVAVSDPLATSSYTVTFARSVTNCVVHAVQGFGDPAGTGGFGVAAYPTVTMEGGTPQEVGVFFTDHTGTAQDTSFLIAALC